MIDVVSPDGVAPCPWIVEAEGARVPFGTGGELMVHRQGVVRRHLLMRPPVPDHPEEVAASVDMGHDDAVREVVGEPDEESP